jgi:hypothetical protein
LQRVGRSVGAFLRSEKSPCDSDRQKDVGCRAESEEVGGDTDFRQRIEVANRVDLVGGENEVGIEGDDGLVVEWESGDLSYAGYRRWMVV